MNVKCEWIAVANRDIFVETTATQTETPHPAIAYIEKYFDDVINSMHKTDNVG